MSRKLNFVLKHCWWFLLPMVFLTFLPIVGVIGIVIATLITLILNPIIGGLFTLAVSIPNLASLLFSKTDIFNLENPLVFMLWGAVAVSISSNIITWSMALLLRRKMTWSNLIQLITLLGILFISILHLIFPDIPAWWAHKLTLSFNQLAKGTDLVQHSSLTLTEVTVIQSQAVEAAKFYASGLFVAAILFFAALQLVMARSLQAYLSLQINLKNELYSIRLSPLAGISILLICVWAYLGNYVALDILPMIFLLFMVAGLSLSHFYLNQLRPQVAIFWIGVIYISLIFAQIVTISFLILLALSDIGFNLRQYALKKN